MLLPSNSQKTESLVLFLDDMEHRHFEFRRVTNFENVRVVHAYTAAEAIRFLSSDEAFDQVFLDHDLSESDIMVTVDGPSLVPTGMSVVNHILTMDKPPQRVIIHSCNGPAAAEMKARLEPLNLRELRNVPFPELVRLLKGQGGYRFP